MPSPAIRYRVKRLSPSLRFFIRSLGPSTGCTAGLAHALMLAPSNLFWLARDAVPRAHHRHAHRLPAVSIDGSTPPRGESARVPRHSLHNPAAPPPTPGRARTRDAP